MPRIFPLNICTQISDVIELYNGELEKSLDSVPTRLIYIYL